MEKTVNRPWFLVLLSAVMAAVMLAISPLQVYAVTTKTANTYISELILVTGDQLKDEKLKDYTVLDTPIYKNELDSGNGAGATYLAYKTTDRPEEAITDIRAMNMNGGWSFAEYENYLDELQDNAEKLAGGLWAAVLEFRDLYNNEETRTENVEYAYELLNLLYDDDVTDADGDPMRLGDLFADPDIIKSSTDERYTTIFLESNVDALQMIYTALGNACSKTDGMTFLERIAEDPFELLYEYCDDDSLDSAVDQLMLSIDNAREYINYYQNSAHFESFPSDEVRQAYLTALGEQDKRDGTSCLTDWMKGYTLTKELCRVEYFGTEGDFETLYDLITVDDDLYEDDEYMLPNLRPLVGAMSEGMRNLMVLGLSQIVSICTTRDGHYRDTLDELEAEEGYGDVLENGISIFAGIDREIYEEHAVAMTSAAIRANAEGDSSWRETLENNEDAAKLHSVSQTVMIVSGSLIFAGLVVIGLIFAGDVTVGESVQLLVQLLTFSLSSLGGAGYQILGVIWGTMLWGAILSVAAFIVAVVLFCLSKKTEEPEYDTYLEIPGMLCDYRTVTDRKTGAEIDEYIYYYGVADPCGVRETALFANDGQKAQELPENKKGVMDIYNWELRGERQWLALYTTKDRRAGYPIRSDAAFCVTGENKSGLFAAFFGDESSKACDLAQFYNFSISSNPKADDKKQVSPVYLGYTVDENAKYEDSAEQQVMGRLVGSAVSNGASWVMSAIGLALGCVGGFIVGKHSKKKKEEK